MNTRVVGGGGGLIYAAAGVINKTEIATFISLMWSLLTKETHRNIKDPRYWPGGRVNKTYCT